MFPSRSKLIAIMAKSIDDLLLAGFPDVADPIMTKINNRFQLGTCHSRSGTTSFLRIKPPSTRWYDYIIWRWWQASSVGIDADMTNSKATDRWTSQLGQERSFPWVNSSIEWLGITTSSPCAEFASRMQKNPPGRKNIGLHCPWFSGFENSWYLMVISTNSGPIRTHALRSGMLRRWTTITTRWSGTCGWNTAWRYAIWIYISHTVVESLSCKATGEIYRGGRNPSSGRGHRRRKMLARTF